MINKWNEIAAEIAKDGTREIGLLGEKEHLTTLLAHLASDERTTNHFSVYTDEMIDLARRDISKVFPLAEIGQARLPIFVIASDQQKQRYLSILVEALNYIPKIIYAGYEHFAFDDPIYLEEVANLAKPSLANGYKNCQVHIFQCLQNAARLRLDGVVTEFGMFQGGTTMLISKLIERLGMDWRVYGFDTFSGFPPKKHLFDMYSHPDCAAVKMSEVSAYLTGRNVEIVAGDIVNTVAVLLDRPIVFTFLDTDNFSAASAALDVVQEQTVVGGSILFDHYTGEGRFKYTLGEKLAGDRLLSDSRYFHLHGTGVFYKQRN